MTPLFPLPIIWIPPLPPPIFFCWLSSVAQTQLCNPSNLSCVNNLHLGNMEGVTKLLQPFFFSCEQLVLAGEEFCVICIWREAGCGDALCWRSGLEFHTGPTGLPQKKSRRFLDWFMFPKRGAEPSKWGRATRQKMTVPRVNTKRSRAPDGDVSRHCRRGGGRARTRGHR